MVLYFFRNNIWDNFFSIAIIKNKTYKIQILDFGSVLFSSISIIGGLKLGLITFITAYSTDQQVDMNSIYTTYGGIAVIWLSITNISKKFKEITYSQNLQTAQNTSGTTKNQGTQ